MGASLPYVNSVGALHKLIGKLRKKFPDSVSVDTLKKLGLAPKNETYLINTLRFLDFIDDDGARVVGKTKHFQADNSGFSDGMGKAIEAAYSDLFETHGKDAWALDKSELTTYFRMSDDTSEIIGQRQASTFLALAAEAGHGDVPAQKDSAKTTPKIASGPRSKKKAVAAPTAPASTAVPIEKNGTGLGGMNFSLRVEMNLPTTDEKAVYDALFQSIRENLIEPYQSE